MHTFVYANSASATQRVYQERKISPLLKGLASWPLKWQEVLAGDMAESIWQCN